MKMECERCTFLNVANAAACAMCGTAFQSSLMAAVCPACTFANPAGALLCGVCDANLHLHEPNFEPERDMRIHLDNDVEQKRSMLSLLALGQRVCFAFGAFGSDQTQLLGAHHADALQQQIEGLESKKGTFKEISGGWVDQHSGDTRPVFLLERGDADALRSALAGHLWRVAPDAFVTTDAHAQLPCQTYLRRILRTGMMEFDFGSGGLRLQSSGQEVRVLLLGLDGAGKTLTLYMMKLGEIVTTIPTIGFNVENVMYRGVSISIWDVGGQDKIRPLWRHYLPNTHLLCFMIDSSNSEVLENVCYELSKLLLAEELIEATCMVLCNKQDLKNAMSVSAIEAYVRPRLPNVPPGRLSFLPWSNIGSETIPACTDVSDTLNIMKLPQEFRTEVAQILGKFPSALVHLVMDYAERWAPQGEMLELAWRLGGGTSFSGPFDPHADENCGWLSDVVREGIKYGHELLQMHHALAIVYILKNLGSEDESFAPQLARILQGQGLYSLSDFELLKRPPNSSFASLEEFFTIPKDPLRKWALRHLPDQSGRRLCSLSPDEARSLFAELPQNFSTSHKVGYLVSIYIFTCACESLYAALLPTLNEAIPHAFNQGLGAESLLQPVKSVTSIPNLEFEKKMYSQLTDSATRYFENGWQKSGGGAVEDFIANWNVLTQEALLGVDDLKDLITSQKLPPIDRNMFTGAQLRLHEAMNLLGL